MDICYPPREGRIYTDWNIPWRVAAHEVAVDLKNRVDIYFSLRTLAGTLTTSSRSEQQLKIRNKATLEGRGKRAGGEGGSSGAKGGGTLRDSKTSLYILTLARRTSGGDRLSVKRLPVRSLSSSVF